MKRNNSNQGATLGVRLMVLIFVLALVLQAQPAQAWFTDTPYPLTAELQSTTAAYPFSYNTTVAQMLGEVQQTDVYNYAASLTGVTPITVGGAAFTLTTRNMNYSTHISKATQYVYEFMQARGLAVHYETWYDSGEDISSRNVIGEITGGVRPTEIILITAHLDDMPNGSVAPGADDNASGSAAVMMAAARMAGHHFERTVRFVFFTGEEQGFLGSDAYAAAAKTRGDNILAVFNMDMIGWDDNNDGVLALETRYTTSPGYANDLAIANLFIQVVGVYGGLSGLHPFVDPIYDEGVDSISFWNRGYSSVTAIEDWEEGNPYYHTKNDTLATLNLAYFTSFIKASLGTVAHMALPLADTTFADVPTTHWAWTFIESLYQAGVTGGCAANPLLYCPAKNVTRAEMAVFILRAEHGDTYSPPEASGNVFNDVPLGYWAAGWIEQLTNEGITGGCGNGNYCPAKYVTRAEMAVFLLRGKHGNTYTPPAASGSVFDDISADFWAASWIEQLYAEGITGGCEGGNYCPGIYANRAQMAVFLVRTFSLP
ncbi:MAG: M20/M25/M40 family metallo-hydrolase [Chloroflexi bacterium]|nr:M20/M25/M40 family metallo-hydrolase [Chloroflexota bacterium]